MKRSLTRKTPSHSRDLNDAKQHKFCRSYHNSENKPIQEGTAMRKFRIALGAACRFFSVSAIVLLIAAQAQANDRKIKVTAPGAAGATMEVKVSTVDTKTVGDLMTETFTVTIPNMPTPASKAAAIITAINATATNVTAAIDPGDNTQVIITSVAGRSISRVDPRPLKSGEQDKLAALGPADGENPNSPALVGLDLDGTGSQVGTATIDIGGTPFTVATSDLETNTQVLDALMTQIDMSSMFKATVTGDELDILGSVLGNEFSAFVSDTNPTSEAGYSYGFFEQTLVPEPSSLVLFAASLIGLGAALRRRLPSA
jgi:hypothetical protein